jgi:hypothetical protein
MVVGSNGIKKKKINNFLIFGIFAIFLFSLSGMWQHEMIHTQINQTANVESKIVFSLKDDYIPAIGVARLNQPTKEITTYEALHIQNEIINYNLFTPLIGIMFMIFAGFVYMGEKIGGLQ